MSISLSNLLLINIR